MNQEWAIKPDSLEFRHEETAMHGLIDLGDEQSIDEILSRPELVAGCNAGPLLSKKFGVKVLSRLTDIAHQKNDMRSHGAKQGIMFIEDPEAVPQLQQMLNDKELRLPAIYALGHLASKSSSAAQSLHQTYSQSSLHERAVITQTFLINESGWGGGKRISITPSTLRMLSDLLDETSKKQDLVAELEVLNNLVTSRDPQVVPILRHYLADPALPRRDSGLVNRTQAAWGIWKITGEKYDLHLKPSELNAFQLNWNELEREEKFNQTTGSRGK